MKASAVVTQLRNLLPQLTDKFTANTTINSLTRSGTVLTAVCDDAHGLEVGKAVAIVGAVTRMTISSLTRSGTVGTLVTTSNHDMTESTATEITISGATESEFNDTFTRLEVQNRKTITFTMADSGATVATGSPVLHAGESALRDYNTTYAVAQIPNDFTFEVTHAASTMLDPTGSMEARARPRISAAVNPERAIDSYTAKDADDLWLFVILGDVETSKSRRIQSDAHDNIGRSASYRQQVTQNFGVHLYIPCSTEIGAADARDQAEDLFRPICRSLLGTKFDSGLYLGQKYATHCMRHGTELYTTAVYVHVYEFQQAADITYDDTVGPALDVAFRDIDFTMDPDLGGTTTLTGTVDLDDKPL